MESITKNRQSVQSLRAMVARAYGDGQVPDGDGWYEELGHGWFNVAYRIRLRDGQQVVLKIAPPAGVQVMTYERDMMRIEVHALTLLREHTPVPVPAVHRYDDSHELCDADYFFMPYIDADNLAIVKDQLPADEVKQYAEMIGAANRTINAVKGDHFGSLLGGDPTATWRQVFTGIVEDVLRDGERRGVDLGWDYALIRSLLAEHADCLDEVTEPVFVEWDLWDGNVMVRDGAIMSIIDHERALYGDPLMEAGFVSIELPEFGYPDGFVRGYGSAPATPAELMRRRLYSMHLILIMVIETVYRGHAEPHQYNWARKQLDALLAMFGHRR